MAFGQELSAAGTENRAAKYPSGGTLNVDRESSHVCFLFPLGRFSQVVPLRLWYRVYGTYSKNASIKIEKSEKFTKYF
jgi:hypothetical protein